MRISFFRSGVFSAMISFRKSCAVAKCCAIGHFTFAGARNGGSPLIVTGTSSVAMAGSGPVSWTITCSEYVPGAVPRKLGVRKKWNVWTGAVLPKWLSVPP